jgi:hypothetical protein
MPRLGGARVAKAYEVTFRVDGSLKNKKGGERILPNTAAALGVGTRQAPELAFAHVPVSGHPCLAGSHSREND